jgi:protein-disulfide isomerase
VRSQGGPGGVRQASPRTLAIAGGVILVVIVAIVLGIVLSQSGNAGAAPGTYDGPTVGIPGGYPAVGSSSNPNAMLYSGDVAKLFKGIPQQGFVLGQPNAPVTLVEYIDLQCPVCQAFETEVFPDLIKQYVRPGKVKVEMRPWAFIGPDSLRGQAATIAAMHQNRAFQFAQLLYFNQGTENTGWLTDSVLAFDAASIDGMNVKQVFNERNASSVKDAAKTVDRQATADKVTGTPALFVGRSNQKLKYVTMQNGLDRESITSALNNALAGI